MAGLHTCTQIDSGIDCTACKLAQLCEVQGQKSNVKGQRSNVKGAKSEEEYSISEELTADGSGKFSIFYLVLAAAATLGCVVFFTWMFK